MSCWHKQPLLDDSNSIAKYLHATKLLTKGGLNSQNDNVRVPHLPLKQLWQQLMPGTGSLRFSASFISSSVSNNLLPMCFMEPWAPATHHLFTSCRPFNLSHHHWSITMVWASTAMLMIHSYHQHSSHFPPLCLVNWLKDIRIWMSANWTLGCGSQFKAPEEGGLWRSTSSNLSLNLPSRTHLQTKTFILKLCSWHPHSCLITSYFNYGNDVLLVDHPYPYTSTRDCHFSCALAHTNHCKLTTQKSSNMFYDDPSTKMAHSSNKIGHTCWLLFKLVRWPEWSRSSSSDRNPYYLLHPDSPESSSGSLSDSQAPVQQHGTQAPNSIPLEETRNGLTLLHHPRNTGTCKLSHISAGTLQL